jgi:hypothetical protein
MKHLVLIALLLLVSGKSYSQTISPADFQVLTEAQWLEFRGMISMFKFENKINHEDAERIKWFSSNSNVSNQTNDHVVKKHGKISPDDIAIVIRFNTSESDYLIVITSYLGFLHSFKYDINTIELSRISTMGALCLAGSESIKFKNVENSRLIFNTEDLYSESGNWTKYFLLDLEKNSFFHWKNCSTKGNGEECKLIENFNKVDRD